MFMNMRLKGIKSDLEVIKSIEEDASFNKEAVKSA
jgi:hypothetical protein